MVENVFVKINQKPITTKNKPRTLTVLFKQILDKTNLIVTKSIS